MEIEVPHQERRPGWRRWLPRPIWDTGKRGSILLLLGTLWVLEGVSLIDYEIPGPHVAHQFLPNWIGVGAWVVTGLIAVAAALRPPGIPDHWGFTALYLMPAIRFISYAMGWVASWGLFDPPPWMPSFSEGWRYVALYAGLVGVIMICAGWREPLPTRRERNELG